MGCRKLKKIKTNGEWVAVRHSSFLLGSNSSEEAKSDSTRFMWAFAISSFPESNLRRRLLGSYVKDRANLGVKNKGDNIIPRCMLGV